MNAARVSVALILILLTGSAVAAAEAPAGASSCTGCHAAGAGVEAMRSLAGRPQAEIDGRMTAFKSGREPATIMDRIAKGFSEDEIRAIAAWFAAQK